MQIPETEGAVRTPDQRVRVVVSSTLKELEEEREAASAAIERLHLIPVMFELGARPHPPRALYSAYLEQSDVFVGIYWERYGWKGPEMDVSGLEDEYDLSAGMPSLLYVKHPAPNREPGLERLLDRIRDALSVLLDHSLVRVVEGRSAHGPRFAMLETIREYALERLDDSPEAEGVRDRHAAYFLSFAEQRTSERRGFGQLESAARLANDHDNLRTALDRLASKPDLHAAVRLAWALWLFWWQAGHIGEQRRVAALVDDIDALAAEDAGKLLFVAGGIAQYAGRFGEAQALAKQSWQRFQDAGFEEGLALAAMLRGFAAYEAGEGGRRVRRREPRALSEASGRVGNGLVVEHALAPPRTPRRARCGPLPVRGRPAARQRRRGRVPPGARTRGPRLDRGAPGRPSEGRSLIRGGIDAQCRARVPRKHGLLHRRRSSARPGRAGLRRVRSLARRGAASTRGARISAMGAEPRGRRGADRRRGACGASRCAALGRRPGAAARRSR